ncbi:hypothetical protein LEP1GSC061_0027 [Leptospira wolffii serovar Khorat str. Khorat-H2]|nr:hypothetical protein LEP1GSC061_0027 [Leptospira wolffii serovar Khorat str. Khorat-H2]
MSLDENIPADRIRPEKSRMLTLLIALPEREKRLQNLFNNQIVI